MFFFFNDTATTEIYTLSLHDALPISGSTILWCEHRACKYEHGTGVRAVPYRHQSGEPAGSSATQVTPRLSCTRSEEHTSELQSRQYLVCRLLLEKTTYHIPYYNFLT